MKEILEYLVTKLVKEPESIKIDYTKDGKINLFHVKVSDIDLGVVIGRNGNTAQAIRTIVKSFCKAGERVVVKFEGNE